MMPSSFTSGWWGTSSCPVLPPGRVDRREHELEVLGAVDVGEDEEAVAVDRAAARG